MPAIPTVVPFADGRHLDVTAWPGGNWERIVGIDERNLPVVDDGHGGHMTVTECCGATVTGTDSGIACRACYSDQNHNPGIPTGKITPHAIPVYPDDDHTCDGRPFSKASNDCAACGNDDDACPSCGLRRAGPNGEACSSCA